MSNSKYYPVPFADFVRYENIGLGQLHHFNMLGGFSTKNNKVFINFDRCNIRQYDIDYVLIHEIIHGVDNTINPNMDYKYENDVFFRSLCEYVTDWLSLKILRLKMREHKNLDSLMEIYTKNYCKYLPHYALDYMLIGAESDFLKSYPKFDVLSALVQRLKFTPKEMEFTF